MRSSSSPLLGGAHALPGVRFRELQVPEAAWNIAVAWRRDAGDGPAVRRFVETVTSVDARRPRGQEATRTRDSARAGRRPGGRA